MAHWMRNYQSKMKKMNATKTHMKLKHGYKVEELKKCFFFSRFIENCEKVALAGSFQTHELCFLSIIHPFIFSNSHQLHLKTRLPHNCSLTANSAPAADWLSCSLQKLPLAWVQMKGVCILQSTHCSTVHCADAHTAVRAWPDTDDVLTSLHKAQKLRL